jgi:hypothetical protein
MGKQARTELELDTEGQTARLARSRNLNLTNHTGLRHHGPRSLHGYIDARITFVTRDKHRNDQLMEKVTEESRKKPDSVQRDADGDGWAGFINSGLFAC